MAEKPITETVTVERKVTGVILDLIQFARRMADSTPEQLADDAYMVSCARNYWDQQHGE